MISEIITRRSTSFLGPNHRVIIPKDRPIGSYGLIHCGNPSNEYPACLNSGIVSFDCAERILPSLTLALEISQEKQYILIIFATLTYGNDSESLPIMLLLTSHIK